jgi:4-amino-4-deoxy-L-arabinose transferase-like glycosyltransferase
MVSYAPIGNKPRYPNKPDENEAIPPAPPMHRTFVQLVLVGLLALVVRGGAIVARFDQLAADPDGYRAIATELRTTGRFARRDGDGPAFATAYRPPLYPLLLATVGSGDEVPSSQVAVLHTLLGVATALLTYLLACRYLHRGFAVMAALFVIVDPLLINQSSLVMTETLAALLTLLAVAALVRWSNKPTWPRAALAGVVIGLCILCRPTYLIWLALFLLVGLAPRRLTSRTFPRWQLLGLLAAAALVLSPWIMRNVRVFGRPIATTTHGGYTLLLGNNPYFYDFVQTKHWTDAWEAEAFHAAWRQRRSGGDPAFAVASPQAELREDARAYDWAKESMRQQPTAFVVACCYRLWQFVSPLPNRVQNDESFKQQLLRYAVAVWYVVLYGLVAAGLPAWRRADNGGLLLATATLLIAFLGIHACYWTNLRMRAPLMPLICIAAAMGAERLVHRATAIASDRSDNDTADSVV